ncbi:hypothetical protein EMCRGX_G007656 [Ephydatia muelleri]
MDSPAADTNRAPIWTLEQQSEELTRRRDIVSWTNKGEIRFLPRATDIIVSATPKSGTTWLVYICHQLRTGGAEPDFEEFDKVVTFLEVPLSVNGTPVDLEAVVHPAEPRIFYSHVSYESLPKGGKILHCVRDPKDVFYSLLTYLDTLLLLKGRVSTLKDLLRWWEHRSDKDVLFVFFDDLKEDHALWVRRIAEFIGVSCNEQTLARVVWNTTHAEMAKHQSRFVDHSIIAECAKMFGDDPPSEPIGRVRKDGGKLGEGEKLPIEMQELIDTAWHDIITTKLGFRDYKEMREAWMREGNTY